MRSSLVVLSTAFAVVMLSGCLEPKDFEVRKVGIGDLRQLGEAETAVGVDLSLFNPNGYKVGIDASQLGLWLAGDSVGRLVFAEGEELDGKAEATVRLDAILDSKRFGDVLSRNWLEFMVQGAPIRVEGWVEGSAWGVRRTLQIRHEQRLSILN